METCIQKLEGIDIAVRESTYRVQRHAGRLKVAFAGGDDFFKFVGACFVFFVEDFQAGT